MTDRPANPVSPIAGDWVGIVTAPPPEGVELQTCIWDTDGMRNIQPLVRKGRLWFFPDMSMYVYYTPTHWQVPV